MRILFDARKLFCGGIGRYIANTLLGLTTSITDNNNIQVTLILSPQVQSNFTCESSLSSSIAKLPSILNTAKLYSYNEYFRFDKCFDKKDEFNWSQFDLFHTPHYVLPKNIPIPSVVTVHDLIHINYPEHWYYPYVAKYLVSNALLRSSAVIAVSEATKSDILQKIDISDSSRINVIPNSFESLSKSSKLDTDDLLDSNKRYILAVLSDSKPHKGINILINGYKKYLKEIDSNEEIAKLFIAGKGSLAPRIKEESSKCQHIKPLGFVSEYKLINLYKHAECLIVTSLSEGFCLPVLEAHSYHTKVLSTPVPAITELLTDDDTVMSSFSSDEFSQKLYEVLKVPKVEVSYNLEKYSIKSTTEKLIKLYKSIL